MATITRERLIELQELYEALKVRVLSIDEKYSLDYVEPKLDLPDSLNLQKLEYTPKTEEELTALAEQAVAAIIISKQASIEKAYSSKLKSVAIKLTQNKNNHFATVNGIMEKYLERCEKIKRRAIEHGLVFSTVTTKYLDKENSTNLAQLQDAATYTNQKSKLIEQEGTDAEEIYQQSCAAQLCEEQNHTAGDHKSHQQEKDEIAPYARQQAPFCFFSALPVHFSTAL